MVEQRQTETALYRPTQYAVRVSSSTKYRRYSTAEAVRNWNRDEARTFVFAHRRGAPFEPRGCVHITFVIMKTLIRRCRFGLFV